MAGYYPPVGFHFSVEFGISTNTDDARFQSVGGLSMEYETEAYKEGGENRFEHSLPVRTKFPDLVLKRGFLVKDSQVYDWCVKAFRDREFTLSDITIKLLDEKHEPIKTWNVVGAYPKKWSVSDFNAETNSVVIENLELKYKYFTVR